MIEAKELTKRYGGKTAADGLSFTVRPGRVTGFLGPNGAGKSTTMRLILGLDAPSAGTVTVGGRPYARLPAPLRTVGCLLDAKGVHGGRTAYRHLAGLAASCHDRATDVRHGLLIVLLTGFARADAIATLVVVALMFKAGYGLMRESGRIFLEAAPADVDPDALGDKLVAQPAVVEVHDLHVWQITSGQTALSAHVLVEPGGDCHAVRRDLEELLQHDYGITHTTLQVDHTPEEVLQLALPGEGAGDAAHCEDPHGPIHRDGPHKH
ncbi:MULTISPECIES: cation diffusion facilitator family transporter [unclassified Streptomyces]|uniref:cation diffusion facilitator family transporter n=1 Tax=unclassified Streptomyces TaxID=2593676 RepID=UPI0036DFCFDE